MGETFNGTGACAIPIRAIERTRLTREDREHRYKRYPDIAPGSYELVTSLPAVCVPHGQSSSRSHEFVVESYPRPSFGIWEVPFRTVFHRAEQRMRGKAWLHADFAMCDRCVARLQFFYWRAIAFVLLGIAALIAFWIGAGMADTPRIFMLPLFAGILLIWGGIVSLRSARAKNLFGAELLVDGSAMVLENPHPAFVASVLQAPGTT
ncbi:hypothetical protein HT102_04740 [Hoyosella sp. G463]|uniref:Uncharacterized protein n=1 Tax=Lolliginicoccus lacisalsi TaxID=2742202 RepID=A0A927PLW5_9ACTN|nr:hypothetical protein [Lolliginicoccus lacisalsi]MBD8505791.1 hypothetical protein [Lolliginicoccus lacisalsi]